MSKEIERKFLTLSDDYRRLAVSVTHICQGYLSDTPEATVRVRLRDNRGFITVKGRTSGCTRSEWEYEIPAGDAREMLQLCPRVLEKLRYIVPWKGMTWEVDEFAGKLAPLVVAEIELPAEDTPFGKPPFVGREVTDDPQFYNSNLIKRC